MERKFLISCLILLVSNLKLATAVEECSCSEPLDPGPCLANIPRFYYCEKSRTCKQFIYGGCKGNKNNFETFQSCIQQCHTNETALPCHYTVDPGPCKAYVDRFYYDVDTNKCMRFKYGGCAGNSNNFEQLQDCENACINHDVTKPPMSQEVCELPMVTGPCKGAFPRFYFDTTSNTCKQFIYGGCGGNMNNFLNEADCKKACDHTSNDVCSLPAFTGPCKAYFERFYFDKTTGSCKQFIYGGCQSNGNNFNTVEECEAKCRKVNPCNVEKKVGPCRGAFNRYYYDKVAKNCLLFSWGGCQPNENNFLTLEDCRKACPKKPTTTEDKVCSLPAFSGPCEAYIERFYFDKNTGFCKQFVYGGCQSNGNNFNTVEECEAKCGKVNPCNVEQKVGPCKAAINRYYYDKDTEKCLLFSWGGCQPNENNFLTLEDCEKVCPKKPSPTEDEVCTLPAFGGPCFAYFKRFYFDKTTGSCKQFIYGGCQSNGNNFNTVEECEAKCRKVNPCNVEKKVGPCRAAINRYYYDKDAGKCLLFSWGGCEPNENNFLTLEDCQKVCPNPTTEVYSGNSCNVEVQSGPCHGAFPRYFYNKATGNCLQFSWGGCQANANNFMTLEDCEDECVTVKTTKKLTTKKRTTKKMKNKEKLCSCEA